jgi:hypothetical protein
LAKLGVGHVLGGASSPNTIWIEEEYLQPEKPNCPISDQAGVCCASMIMSPFLLDRNVP